MDYFVLDRTFLYDTIKAICSEIHDNNTLQQQQNNFEDFLLKIKQLRYLLFSSQQLPAWPWVYSCIILQDEC